MIGVDTNILIRAVLDDHPKESKVAKDLLYRLVGEKKLFISSYAILEMIWVLKVKKVPKENISEALLSLLDSPGVTIGGREIVIAALEKYLKGKADFGDYLILAEGEANNAAKLVSFDKTLYKENSSCEHPTKSR